MEVVSNGEDDGGPALNGAVLGPVICSTAVALRSHLEVEDCEELLKQLAAPLCHGPHSTRLDELLAQIRQETLATRVPGQVVLACVLLFLSSPLWEHRREGGFSLSVPWQAVLGTHLHLFNASTWRMASQVADYCCTPDEATRIKARLSCLREGYQLEAVV